MNQKILSKCPFCKKELEITELSCTDCGTSIKGKFSVCEFCNLSEEELNFVRVFLKSRGNIKEVEKELEISYPTVKNRLNLVLLSLGYETKETPEADDRMEILKKLENNEMTYREALELLSKRKER
jgi:hypothetical protein